MTADEFQVVVGPDPGPEMVRQRSKLHFRPAEDNSGPGANHGIASLQRFLASGETIPESGKIEVQPMSRNPKMAGLLVVFNRGSRPSLTASSRHQVATFSACKVEMGPLTLCNPTGLPWLPENATREKQKKIKTAFCRGKKRNL